MLTMVIMMMIILKTNNDDNACYREKVDGGDGHEQDEGGFHKGTPFTLSFKKDQRHYGVYFIHTCSLAGTEVWIVRVAKGWRNVHRPQRPDRGNN